MDSNRSRRILLVIALASISGYIIWSNFFSIGTQLATYMYFPVYIVTIIALVIFSEIISYNKGNINETLTARSLFFIYCCHGLWVSVASKLVTYLIHPDGTAGFLFSYILLFFLLWYLDMLIYVIFNRLTPSLVKVLTGGRS